MNEMIECPGCNGTTVAIGGCFPFDPCPQCQLNGLVCISCLSNPCECNNFDDFMEKYELWRNMD